MHSPTTRPGQLFATLVTGMNGAGVVWVFALMFLICADITARTLFDNPIAGVTEMVSLSLVASVFLQLGYAVLRGRMMHVEMFVTPLEAKRPTLASDWHLLLCAVGIAMVVVIGRISSLPGGRRSSRASRASSKSKCGRSSCCSSPVRSSRRSSWLANSSSGRVCRSPAPPLWRGCSHLWSL
jgi:hypothetical protein